MRVPAFFAASVVGAGSLLANAVPTEAQSVETFYKSQNQMSLITGFGPASGYDVWARLAARHMGRHIPGNPTIIVRNMPGAGSLTAANHLHNVAPKDGTVLGSFSRNLPAQALIGLENVRFDARNFGWIGSPELTFVVCAAIASTGITTVEQLRKTELFVGGTGPGSAPSFMPLVVNQLAGTKFKVIEGYRSSEDVHLAMERAELGGICGATYDSFLRQEGERVKAGKTKVLFNLEEQRNPLLGDVPSIFEYITDPESRQMLTFMNLPQEMGRPYAAPPGLPKDRLEALRRAFDATMTDADFLADAERQKVTVTALTGEEVEKKINDLYTIPQPIIDKANALMTRK